MYNRCHVFTGIEYFETSFERLLCVMDVQKTSRVYWDRVFRNLLMFFVCYGCLKDVTCSLEVQKVFLMSFVRDRCTKDIGKCQVFTEV